jgi:hypothetical protein
VRASTIGFQPSTRIVTVTRGEELRVDFTMTTVGQQLAPVVVHENSSSSLFAEPSGFDQRRRAGQGGHYITADDIAKRQIIDAEQLFHGIPSVSVDTGGIIVIKRGEISFRDFYLSRKDMNQSNTCIGAQVFVDGAAMPQPFNINSVAIQEIRGIEIYAGPATTPPELRSVKSICGTIAIWTTRG